MSQQTRSNYTNYALLQEKAIQELRRFPNGIKADRLATRLGIAAYKLTRAGRRKRNNVLLLLLQRLQERGAIRLEMERFATKEEFPFVFLTQEEEAA